MAPVIGHIIEFAPADPVALGTVVLTATIIGFGLWLAVQHHVVKHGGLRWRSIRRTALGGLVIVAAAAIAPAVADGQDPQIPTGLPDLVSEAPIIWFDKVVEYDDGTLAKVVAFDGYLHNIGDGMLDLYGNPQEPGGVKQRYYDGEDWVEVGEPRVIYETTDGHNHFHLMTAAEYELWNEARTEKIGDSAKVGFCLVDTEQYEERMDAYYDINAFAYCEQNNPGADELRMGISPGWVDTYDANTTLQWVDVSDVRPGRYWVAAYMDPNDEIVESNEENNGIVFSQNVWPVPGWVARQLPTQRAGEPIRLKSNGYGRVGEVVYRIVEAPANGSLSVPTGVDLRSAEVTYVPDPGFDGIDTFTYVAADVASAYPLNPTEVTVEVDAAGHEASDPTPASEPAPSIADSLERLDVSIYVAVDAQGATGRSDTDRWYASGLPAGLMIDESTGTITGVPTLQGDGVATLRLVSPSGASSTVEIPWTVTLPDFEDRPALDAIADFSSLRDETLNLYIGRGSDGAAYTATGLPDGVRMVENIPLVSGTPIESGEFEIEVVETLDGVETNRSTFTWTVRPRPVPAFPL